MVNPSKFKMSKCILRVLSQLFNELNEVIIKLLGQVKFKNRLNLNKLNTNKYKLII